MPTDGADESSVFNRLLEGFVDRITARCWGWPVRSPNDYKDLSLLFDKESGLLVKSEVRVTVGEGREVGMEFLYSDYKEFDGVKQPGKITVKARNRNRNSSRC